MPRHTDEPSLPPSPSPAPPPVPTKKPLPDETGDGMLDLDDHDQINNQHLEIR